MTHHALPGGRFASERLRDLPTLGLAVVRFMALDARGPLRLVDDPIGFGEAAARWSQSVVDWLRIDLELSGLDTVDWTRPHVVVALHEGLIDPVVLLAAIPSPLRFVARSEFDGWLVVGRALRRSGQILVEPERPVAAARTFLRAGAEALRLGLSPVVFAQGTLLGIETAFEQGAFRLARREAVDVVPVVINGTHRVYEWPFSPVVRRDRPVSVRVLGQRTEPDPEALEREMRAVALQDDHAPVRHFEPDRDGWWDDYRYRISGDYPALAGRVAARRAQDPSRRAIT